LAPVAAFAVPAAVFALSASWEPASWDTAELQGVPYILGITHPTGFPLYVMLGYVWSHAIAISTVAWRMNAMSGAAIAVACVAAYGTARQFGANRIVALLATLWFAFSRNVWAHAARAEAQDLAVMCAALSIYLFVRWMREGNDRRFLGAFALCGAGMAAHPNALWVLPGLVVGAAIAPRRPSPRLIAGALALCVAGLALYLYLPLRSAYVVANHLDPTAALPGAGGGIFWNYNNPSSFSGFVREVTGSDTQSGRYLLAAFNPAHVRDALWTFIVTIHEQYGAIVTLLLAGGFIAAWRRDWPVTLVVTTACLAGLLFSVAYPNESDVSRYRLLVSWLAVPLLGALTPSSPRRRDAVVTWVLALFLATGAALAFAAQRGFLHHSPGENGRWVIGAVEHRVPAGSAVVADWLDATSLAYGAYVDRSLPQRIVLSDDSMRLALYRRWARQLRVFVLVDPHVVTSLPGARDYASLDGYHELYEVLP
jgi:Protein O-mannosyl-transferase TMEM260-like